MASRGTSYKPTEADRIFVERSVMAGTLINEIAECLNITDDTLRKHFRYEITTARARLKGDAVRVLMDSLTDGSLDAAKYVLSRVAGWTESQVVKGPGPNGEHIISTIDPTRLSDTALAELLGAMSAAPETDASGSDSD